MHRAVGNSIRLASSLAKGSTSRLFGRYGTDTNERLYSQSWKPIFDRHIAPSSCNHLQQRRYKIEIPEKLLTKKNSRSSGPGGQSVNKSETRVQLSFNINTADWIPEKVREKMKVIHRNRISKKGIFEVACQVTSSSLTNHTMALQMIQDHLAEAEKAVEDDNWAENEKLDYADWVIQKKIKEGREKDLEKREEGNKRMKKESREKSRHKKELKNFY
mmetsp:Transcript_25869/g.41506  ORF Transcript_25869/g.41506 Transcript_25869/m.41506 type:complete len:217 (-) Transcript_25869:14-664(-)